MIKILKHITGQPFIFATGLAALVHSTWSLGTLFAGEQPDSNDPLQFAFWLLPALLIAFALDVGQIATSAEIRAGQRTATKYITFVVLAAATYYLQWLYIAHHMPQLALASGVRSTWLAFATVMRDAAIWIIPGLLPLSTTLYTLSTAPESHRPIPPEITVSKSTLAHLELPLLEADTEEYLALCQECGWHGMYDSALKSKNALNAHRRHCPTRVELSKNGR